MLGNSSGDGSALHPTVENVSFRKAVYQDDPVPKVREPCPSNLSLLSFRVSAGLLFYRLRVPSIHSPSSCFEIHALGFVVEPCVVPAAYFKLTNNLQSLISWLVSQGTEIEIPALHPHSKLPLDWPSPDGPFFREPVTEIRGIEWAQVKFHPGRMHFLRIQCKG